MSAAAAPRGRWRDLAVAVLALGLVGLWSTSAMATFHLMTIYEVMTGYGGDTSVQFVELRMEAASQNLVGDTVLGAFDDTGTYLGDVLVLPNDVTFGQANRRVLMATSAFQTVTGLAPDFVIPATLPVSAGMICYGAPGIVAPPAGSWDHSDPANYVDCIAYGAYTGPSNFHIGTPTPLTGEGHSMQRVSETNDNAVDFVCADPATPERNDQTGATLAASAACPVGPLTKDAQSCANGFLKGSSKVLKTFGKAAGKCVKDIGAEKPVPTDPATCVMADPKDKITKAEGKVDAGIDKHCSIPYAMDCPPPCDVTDAGDVSAGIDSDDELKACLLCFNAASSWSGTSPSPLKGLHGRILDGVTLATLSTDKTLAKCQAGVVKGYEKLFASMAKELVKCAKAEFKAGAVPPVDSCIGADPKLKVSNTLDKLAVTVGKCTSASPFDAGDCAALSGQPLVDCLETVVRCELCQWGDVLLGGAVDCELFDDSAADASCP